MKLSQLLNSESVIYDLKSKDKDSILKELLSYCDLSNEDISEEEICQELLDREREQTTGIGEGMAFPHARIKGLSKLHIIIGVSKEGIDFYSFDKKPAHYFILMLVAYSRPNELLKTRASIAKLFANQENIKRMSAAENNEDLWQVILDSNIEVDYEITAKDIMRPYIAYIKPENTFNEAAHELHRHHIDCMPVIDDDKTFHGAISCYDLFSYGLPDFFNNLHVISFVKHMNPFEKYFDVDDTLKVDDIINKKEKEDQVISANATLMEIIFEMTVKNKEFLYVLGENNKLRGVIDRYSIIDKIIMAR